MPRKLLSLDDLYDFYLKQNINCTFNRKQDNATIHVHIPETLSFEDTSESSDGFLPVHLKSCHLYRNRNQTYISDDSMNNAIPSFANRPILGFIHQLSDGSYDFAGHEMGINENDELEYYEFPVGVIPESCNAQLVYDKDKNKTYLEVDGLVYEDYSRAADILRKKKESSVSIEIAVDEMSYSASEKVLNIDKFHFMGVTILGKSIESERDIQPGMEGANITLADFSAEKNSLFSTSEGNAKLLEMLKEIKQKVDTLSQFSIDNNQKKGGTTVGKFEELLQKYNITAEQVEFEYEGLSDEELEARFAEVFDEAEDSDPAPSSDGENDDPVDDPVDNEDDPVDDPEDDPEDNPENEPEQSENYAKYSIALSNSVAREFEVSLDDLQYALYRLVNETYTEDVCWYSCTVYDSYLVMHDYYNGRHYKQSWERDSEDNVSLTGERVEVFSKYLTQAEIDALDALKSNYATIKSQLESYQAKELEAQKTALFSSKEFFSIADKDEFKELMNNHAEFSLEELKSKLDSIILSYAKNGGLNFSVVDSNNKNLQKLPINTKKKKNGRYGSIFSK